MRILGFQTDLSLLSRYPPFIHMIARNVEEFHLCYLRGELEEESIIFHHLKFPKVIQKSTILVALPAVLKAFKICRKYGINLIYILDGSYYELSGLLVSKLLGIPLVLRFRTHPVKIRSILRHNYVRRILGTFLTRLAATNAKHIICLNHELRELVLKWDVDPSNVTIIYHGVDVSKFRPKKVKKPYSKVVLFVGVISPVKGIDVLLRVAKMLKDVHFLLVGPVGMNIHEISGNVHYLGSKQHSDMPRYYNMCDVLVLPSYVEAFGDVILEAFACAKPVIASKVGEIPWVVSPKFGWLVETGDVQQLKEAILNALSDKKRLEAMGKAAREFVVNNFKWSLYAKSMIEILGKCVR